MTTEAATQEHAVQRVAPEQAVTMNYRDIREQMEQMARDNKAATFDYEDPAGNKAARSHIYRIRQLNGDIERRRKELKAESLEYGKRVDAAAKELKASVDAMIAVHEQPLKQIEEREAQRKAKIQEAIDNISQSTIDLNQPHTALEVAEAVSAIEGIQITPNVFQERMAEATELRDKCLAEMRAGHAAAVKRETEAAELERLRKAEAERQRKEREERIAREAEERAKREAEQAAQREREAAAKREAEIKAQAERAERQAKEREARLQREHEERLEQQRKEAEAQARREREQREAEERRQQQEREKREADAKHREKIENEAAAAIAEAVGCDAKMALSIVGAIRYEMIPHVRIEF